MKTIAKKYYLIVKNNLKIKEDVSVTEAFELYMLNKFFKLKLNDVSTKMLDFWEKGV